jgi:uncharacterized protein
MRSVVDTNVLVSAVIFPDSVPRQAVKKMLHHGVLLLSEDTFNELKEVLFRSKLDRYVSQEARVLFLAQLRSAAEFIPTIRIVRECRDPRDDKFLEVALNGRGDVIVTGDKDLLRIGPWRGIRIVSPTVYLGSGL